RGSAWAESGTRESVLFSQHGCYPHIGITTDSLHYLLQQFAVESLRLKQLANFLTFTFWHSTDMFTFCAFSKFDLIQLRLARFVITYRHAEAVCNQVCKAEYQRNLWREACAEGTRYYRKRCNAAIDAAKHSVWTCRCLNGTRKPCAHGIGLVLPEQSFIFCGWHVSASCSGRDVVLWDYRLSSALSLCLSIYIFEITPLASQSFNID